MNLIPSFWKIRIWILIIAFLAMFFLIGAVKSALADTGPWTGYETGDTVAVDGVVYILGGLRNNLSTGNTAVWDNGWSLGTYLRALGHYGSSGTGNAAIMEVWTYTIQESCTDSDGDGYCAEDDDCDDTDADIHPDAYDYAYDGVDSDCDGIDTDCYTDTEIDDDGDGYTDIGGDLNDCDSTIYPGATEICGDGIDQDCDGSDLECEEDCPSTYTEWASSIYLNCTDCEVVIDSTTYCCSKYYYLDDDCVYCYGAVEGGCEEEEEEEDETWDLEEEWNTDPDVTISELDSEVEVEITYYLSDEAQDLDASLTDHSFGDRFSTFIDDMSGTAIFSILGDPADDIPTSGDSTITVEAGDYGTHTFDFDTWSEGLEVLKTILIICATWCAIKIMAIKK